MLSSLSIDALPSAHAETRSRGFALVAAAYAALAICYVAAALGTAATRSLWMDEVLAVWTARLPSVTQVVDAIWHGSEFSPPTYDLLLHTLFQLFGYSKLVARLPSIVAILVTAAAMARIVARKLDPPLGVLAFGLVLASGLFGFAIQARPYALMIACQTLALMFWADDPEHRATPRQAGIIALLLALGVSLHVYGILGLAILGMAEAVWSLSLRRARASIWIALATAMLAALAWLPLVRHLATFSTGDSAAPGFYARPTWQHFQQAFIELEPPSIIIVPLLALIVGALIFRALRPRQTTAPAVTPPAILAMTIALLATLPLAFLASLLVTHAFSARYALQEMLGFTLVLVLVARRFPFPRENCLLLVPLLCVIHPGAYEPDDTKEALALIAAAPSGPIVIGEGLLLLQVLEAGPPSLRSRVVYLTAPDGAVPLDPTNEHQILRLQTVLQDLPIENATTFVSLHPTFLELIRSPTSPDDIRPWVAAEHWKTAVAVGGPHGLILEVEASRPHARLR